MRIAKKAGVLALGGLLVTGCAVGPLPDGTGPRTDQTSRGVPTQPVSAQDAARLRRVIEPLARAADRPPARVTVGILSDRSINAANAGGGEFYVTRGLLDRATDEQLLAIMAHEVAHNDLGHVAKAQRRQAGVEIGAAILEEIVPSSAIITPIAGTLITRAYGRSEELEADRHAVTLLRRVGSSKQALEDTLAWLAATSGGGQGGGWFATHPGTNDRIQALRRMP
jgi:putative metalloprotease